MSEHGGGRGSWRRADVGRYQVRQIEPMGPLHSEGLHWKVVDVLLSTYPIMGAFALEMDAVGFARMVNEKMAMRGGSGPG